MNALSALGLSRPAKGNLETPKADARPASADTRRAQSRRLLGVGVVAAMLCYEQSLVREDDLSQVKRAFDLNGYVGILYLVVLAASIYGR